MCRRVCEDCACCGADQIRTGNRGNKRICPHARYRERESHSNSEDCRRGRKTAKKMAVNITSEDREKKRNDGGDADLT